ncbi:hypothetical protein PV327_002825 [Microctonus hyperodae]|uniref:Uncharacterized protein n=1 Tax=Microctonus hyperodae TaxID=165561 RepID=A0AA39FGC4_MICHY|nr:hypothetical protein PV327_002825 [Microctonus hyperodae]
MILRDYLKLIFSVWLSVSTLINSTEGERWSRQVSNSEWIPLAHPRSQIPQSSVSNNQAPPLPSIQALNLPPALRQEYQQQLHQLQRTQESIHKLLLLQQQLRSQQQLLQNQQYLPNVVGPDEEKQQFRPNSIPNAQHSELNSDALSSPQLSAEILPSVYSSQEFKSPHHSQEVGEVPSASGESEEKPENGSNEEVQVVYVPAETLAQRGQPKEERNRDHKQFSFPRQQNQRYPPRHQQQQQQQQQQFHQHHQHPQRQQIENVEDSVNYSEDKPTFNSELVQFPRGQAESDQFFKQARQKELDRLNEERKEIQKQAKIQAAMRQREQERMRQRETEKKLKELEKIEELAKQRELERIREERERHRLDELKREKERVAKLKEELARREIERLAAVERQKQSEIEHSRAQQKQADKYARQEEEARIKESALKKEIAETPTAEQLINQQQHQQHHTETSKHQKRTRNKQRQRPIHHHHHQHKHTSDQTSRNHEIETTTPTPNQPPLAVFMGSDSQVEEVKIFDVLRVLREVKSIAVLDQAVPESPKVFVGPSNLDPPDGYAKFDLPYLSALDTNRFERRVDKLPFFVAPLNFNPPQGYSKIPFPAPHIGSVIINNLEGNFEPSGAALEAVNKPTPNPLIEPNSFIATSGQSTTYQASYESPTVTPYSTYSQEYVTPQYQSTVYPPTSVDKFKYRHQQETYHYEQPTGLQNFKRPQSESISSYEQHATSSSRPHHNSEYTEQSFPGPVTSDEYRRPNVVSSYSYNQEQVSTTPAYQDSYTHTRVQPNKEQDIVSQLAQLNQHDFSHHRHAENNYQHPSQHANVNSYHQQYQLNSNSPNSYEETSIRNPIGPPQYSLPAELPPIHPQLPGLVNSLSEHKESSDKIITTTTTTPEPITTTSTTETPTTTHRVRIRQRGRITRPTTTSTSTTTSSPSTHRSHAERTRRPFNRSRSRHTTTTEEYRETSYEAAKDKVPDTTPRYSNTPEQYRRPNTPKIHKFKTRTSSGDRTTYEPITTLNQIPNIQTHETLSDEASLTDNSGDSRQPTFMQYGSAISTESTPNAYLQQENVENPLNSYSTEIDYSKSPNYPRVHGPPRNDGSPLNIAPISHQQQQYHDRYPAQNGGYHANLDKQPHNEYEYEIRDGISSTLAASPTPNDYSYYQGKVDGGNSEQIPTEPPVYSHILEYAATPQPKLQQDQLSNGDYASSGNFDERNRDEQLYNKYTSKEYFDHQLETTTEPLQTTTTTTTTESAPVVYRQRVRARLGGRPRQESVLQTQPRGPQDEYVRFSAVNPTSSGGRQTSSSSSSSRTRDSPRSRSKTRPNHHNQSQVQSEGNEYVRIQSANRPATYPKTIVQTALRSPTTTTTTTTTSLPLTTPELSVFDDDSNEYGFIRSPNFNQPHHQLSSKFRAPESPIQLQNVAPTDETAEDSSPTHTQVPKHRQKYQSPNQNSTQQIDDINSTSEVSQPRRVGQRRRRVRVRVRPAPPDDFVTAESQNYNSAVNSLVQDRVKYDTHVDSMSGIHSKTTSENLAEKQERPSPLESTELSNSGESILSTDTTTINYTEVPEHARQSEASTLQSIDTDDDTKINNSQENILITTEAPTMNFETTMNDLTTIIPLMTTMTIPRKSWDSTKAYSDWIMRKMIKPFASGDNQFNDKLDNNEHLNAHHSDLTNKLLDNESENHPKNHRSEWSEVHYPSDRGIFGYGRSENSSPTTQLPGIISKSVGDTNVKTLTDYVQAIFDTMKNADKERAIVDNAPNLWSDDQSKSTTSTEIHDITSSPVTVVSLEKISTPSSFPENTDEIIQTTTEKDEDDIVNSTTNIIETSSANLSTQTNTETTTELATTVSSIATTFEPSITTIEQAVDSDKNSTSKLSPVIRTSTTTKVSHMTEICYRGRCIMTKPKKDFHKR